MRSLSIEVSGPAILLKSWVKRWLDLDKFSVRSTPPLSTSSSSTATALGVEFSDDLVDELVLRVGGFRKSKDLDEFSTVSPAPPPPPSTTSSSSVATAVGVELRIQLMIYSWASVGRAAIDSGSGQVGSRRPRFFCLIIVGSYLLRVVHRKSSIMSRPSRGIIRELSILELLTESYLN